MPQPSAQTVCQTCVHYAQTTTAQGQCRLSPPLPGQGNQLGTFPLVSATWWCGQYVKNTGGIAMASTE